MTTPATPTAPVMPPAEPQPPVSKPPPDEETIGRAFNEVVRLARNGERRAVEPLRILLRARPGLAAGIGGDLAWMGLVAAVRNYTGQDLATREAVHQQLAEMGIELAGENQRPTGMERLLIERVLSTWLHLHQLEINYAEHERPTFETDNHYQRLITVTQGRYLAAIKALAEVRRRPLPAVQINIAREQVNVAGDGAM